MRGQARSPEHAVHLDAMRGPKPISKDPKTDCQSAAVPIVVLEVSELAELQEPDRESDVADYANR